MSSNGAAGSPTYKHSRVSAVARYRQARTSVGSSRASSSATNTWEKRYRPGPASSMISAARASSSASAILNGDTPATSATTETANSRPTTAAADRRDTAAGDSNA